MGITDRKGPYRWEREIARTTLTLIVIALAAPLPYFVDILIHTKDNHDIKFVLAVLYTTPFIFCVIVVILWTIGFITTWIHWCLTEKPVESKDELEEY